MEMLLQETRSLVDSLERANTKYKEETAKSELAEASKKAGQDSEVIQELIEKTTGVE